MAEEDRVAKYEKKNRLFFFFSLKSGRISKQQLVLQFIRTVPAPSVPATNSTYMCRIAKNPLRDNYTLFL